jgi:Holliday junction resolvase RusA-like endonuclease
MQQTFDLPLGALELEIQGKPPSWNAVYRARNSYVYMTREGKDWKEYVELLTRAQREKKIWKPDRADSYLAVNIWVWLSRPMDADNVLKVTLDAVAKGLEVNDRRFLPRVWGMLKCKAGEERLRIVIGEEAP